jgi:hypothetical protein
MVKIFIAGDQSGRAGMESSGMMLGIDKFSNGVNRVHDQPRMVLVLDLDIEALLDGHHHFEHINNQVMVFSPLNRRRHSISSGLTSLILRLPIVVLDFQFDAFRVETSTVCQLPGSNNASVLGKTNSCSAFPDHVPIS